MLHLSIHCDILTLHNLILNSNRFRASLLLSFIMPSLYEVPQKLIECEHLICLSLVVFNPDNSAKKSIFSLTNLYLMFNDLQFCHPVACESEGLRMWDLWVSFTCRQRKVLEGIRNSCIALPLTSIKVVQTGEQESWESFTVVVDHSAQEKR